MKKMPMVARERPRVGTIQWMLREGRGVSHGAEI